MKTVSYKDPYEVPVEIYQEEQENGDVIKSVTFRFPIGKGIKKLDFSSGNGQTTSTDVETVVLMSKVK